MAFTLEPSLITAASEKVLILIQTPNATVHRAAANDIAIRTRAARGSACNGLLPVAVKVEGKDSVVDELETNGLTIKVTESSL